MKMMRGIWILFFVVCAVQTVAMAYADPFVQFDRETAHVCEVIDLAASPPPISSDRCIEIDEIDISAHRRAVWVIGEITLEPGLLERTEPLGFFLSAKASSRIYVNGTLLAENGVPGMSRTSETPGDLDFVHPIQRSELQPGPNQVALLLSGHHSITGTTRGLLTLGFFKYERSPYHERGQAMLSLVMLGVFLVSALYAVVLARFGVDKLTSTTLAGTAVFAAGQVVAESLRSVWAYPYYVHDLRLIAIIIFGVGAGGTLLAHTLKRFEYDRPMLVLGASFLITLAGVMLIDGFDAKASVAILIPSLVAMGVSLIPFRSDRRIRLFYASAFGVFALANLLDPGGFLDTTYFAMLAGMILFLSAFQAVAFVESIRDNEKGMLARRHLEQLLARKETKQDPPLIARHSGRLERFQIADILALEAAGDYVNLRLVSGREVLLSASLSELESNLPSRFLRVHRSHIVNADKIVSLKPASSGTGELTLEEGATVPVSRRSMPTLKDALEAS